MKVAETTADGSHVARILLVDDHPLVRKGLEEVLGAENGLMVCGQVATAPDALELVRRHLPDLAIVDLMLGKDSGFDLIGQLRQEFPDLPILVLTMHDERMSAERLLRAGVRGYVTKGEGPKELITAVRQVLGGHVHVSPLMASRVAAGHADTSRSPLHVLSDREVEVFELIGSGFSTREIAEKLGISVKTADSHREHIKLKLDLTSAPMLLKEAVEWMRMRKA